MDNLQVGRHISGQFNEDLERVINNVMQMGGLVEKQVADALSAVEQTDVALAKKVLSNDYQVNAYEVSNARVLLLSANPQRVIYV